MGSLAFVHCITSGNRSENYQKMNVLKMPRIWGRAFGKYIIFQEKALLR